MILCITPNPAIDRTLSVPSLSLGHVHRAVQTIVAAGGKGLNVARAIQVLGGDPFCMGFVGGHAGRLLEDLARKDGLKAVWTWTDSETRTCTVFVAPNAGATEVDEPGIPVSAADWRRLHEDVGRYAASADQVCLSGSLPPESSIRDFQALLDIVCSPGKPVWVDTSGAALEAALGNPRVCIKVNGKEIGRSLAFEVNDLSAAQKALTFLIEAGHPAGAITLGSAGALLAIPEGRWQAEIPRLAVVSPVGSGDSFLAGLVHARQTGRDWSGALREAVAAGSANALSAGGGQFSLEEFEAIRAQVKVTAW